MIITDLAQYLVTQGVGTLGSSIFASYLPDNVDTGLCVIDTGGVAPDVDLPTRKKTFQVFIRGANYTTGQSLLDNVRGELHQLANTQIGDYYFYYILALSDGGHIGKNERGLDEFSINFTALIR
jgi:hypothetical protein